MFVRLVVVGFVCLFAEARAFSRLFQSYKDSEKTYTRNAYARNIG